MPEQISRLKEIIKPKIILVEGKDEENFLDALLKNEGIEDIQIFPFDGKDNLKGYLGAITKTSGFEKVKSIGIIRDADDNPGGAFQSVTDALRAEKLNPPKWPASFNSQNGRKIGVFILPGEGRPGMLESLCLKTIPEALAKCIDSFLSCAKEKDRRQPKNTDKARCRAFLSTMEEDVPSLGIAAQKGLWEWDSGPFKPLLDFLKEM